MPKLFILGRRSPGFRGQKGGLDLRGRIAPVIGCGSAVTEIRNRPRPAAWYRSNSIWMPRSPAFSRGAAIGNTAECALPCPPPSDQPVCGSPSIAVAIDDLGLSPTVGSLSRIGLPPAVTCELAQEEVAEWAFIEDPSGPTAWQPIIGQDFEPDRRDLFQCNDEA